MTKKAGVKWVTMNLFRRGFRKPAAVQPTRALATKKDNPLHLNDFAIESELTVLIGSPDADNKFWAAHGIEVLRSILPPLFRLEVVHETNFRLR